MLNTAVAFRLTAEMMIISTFCCDFTGLGAIDSTDFVLEIWMFSVFPEILTYLLRHILSRLLIAETKSNMMSFVNIHLKAIA